MLFTIAKKAVAFRDCWHWWRNNRNINYYLYCNKWSYSELQVSFQTYLVAFIAIKTPLHINIANNISTIAQPTNPNSSPKIENIKSLWGSGKYKYFCLLSPRPEPNKPPDPIAYKLWITCQPSPVWSCHGSINVVPFVIYMVKI